MEIKSEYYKTWEEYKKEDNIRPEDERFMVPNIQMAEDMMFNFIMFLLM
ncbi:MAG: hypothetical protein ACPLRZ_11090 [Thermovenabulum sp.]